LRLSTWRPERGGEGRGGRPSREARVYRPPPVPSASRRPVCFKLTHYRLFARLTGPPAAAYAHLAEPGELLLYAHVGPEGDGYDEYVLDPDYLTGVPRLPLSEKSDVIIGECGYRSRQIRGHATSGSFWPRVPAADTASRRY
jgi:hypothetical protein